MKYNPSRGGHAPGHLGDALIEALESARGDARPWWELLDVLFFDPARQVWWDDSTAVERANWLIGQLWDCTDTVPGYIRETLGISYASSYATMVRGLKKELIKLGNNSSEFEAASPRSDEEMGHEPGSRFPRSE